MQGGYILCAIALTPLLGGCWETARNSWAPETTVIKYNYSASQEVSAPTKKPAPARPANWKGGDCTTPDQCAFVLKSMVDDPSRSWMRQRASDAAYANGTRQFAYRALRPTLSCTELAHAYDDLAEAHRSHKTQPPGVPVGRLVQVRALNSAVASEIQQEIVARCPGQVRVPSG